MEQEKKFESNEKPLSDLLEMAASGRLQLPDFQRGWVWDDNHIVSLLASVSLSYPIGAVMTLRTGNPDVNFRPRPLEGVEPVGDQQPEFMLLDGQQRMTSLFFALYSREPVPTRGTRGKDLSRHYYANINACIDPFKDREDDGIISVPEDRKITTGFGRQVLLDLERPQIGESLSCGGGANPALVRCAHGPLGPRPRAVWSALSHLFARPLIVTGS